MSTPAPTHTPEDTMIRPLPLVNKIFGEPRFHTDGDVAAVAFAADGTLWSIDDAGLLQNWSSDGKVLGRNFLSDLETLWVFSPGAKLLASGNDDLILWDVASGQLVNRIAQSSWVTAIAFDGEGKTIATGHDDGMVRFWDVRTQKFVGEIAACPKPLPLSAIAFAPQGGFLATVGEDRVVRVWDEITHKMVGELLSHTDRMPALAWNPDGSLLISAGWDTSARVWRPPQADPVILLNSHADQVHTLAYSPDGKYLACADSDFDIYLWTDPVHAGRGAVLRGHNDEIRCLAFSPDGRNWPAPERTAWFTCGMFATESSWRGRTQGGAHDRGDSRHPLRLASIGRADCSRLGYRSGEEVAPTACARRTPLPPVPTANGSRSAARTTSPNSGMPPKEALAASLEATKPPIGAAGFLG